MADEQDTIADAVRDHILLGAPNGTHHWVCSCGKSGNQPKDGVERVRWWANHVGMEIMLALKMTYEYGVRQEVTREINGKTVTGTSITTAGTDMSYDYAIELLDERSEWIGTTRHGVQYGNAAMVRRVASGWEATY